MSRLARFLLLFLIGAALTTTSASDVITPQATNQSPSEPGNASPQTPGNVSPPAPNIDPAAAIFPSTATAGLLLVTVKPDRVEDYEEVIRALQEALSRATDGRQLALAQGWRVFKSHTDPKANAVYVHFIDPVAADTDYRPSRVLDELLAGASAEMLVKYRDAIAGAPSMLGMEEFADMSEPPPAKPANGSPDAPPTAKKPGA